MGVPQAATIASLRAELEGTSAALEAAQRASARSGAHEADVEAEVCVCGGSNVPCLPGPPLRGRCCVDGVTRCPQAGRWRAEAARANVEVRRLTTALDEAARRSDAGAAELASLRHQVARLTRERDAAVAAEEAAASQGALGSSARGEELERLQGEVERQRGEVEGLRQALEGVEADRERLRVQLTRLKQQMIKEQVRELCPSRTETRVRWLPETAPSCARAWLSRDPGRATRPNPVCTTSRTVLPLLADHNCWCGRRTRRAR
jgi:DNA repair exonuclease SbcCD ATPase subunit